MSPSKYISKETIMDGKHQLTTPVSIVNPHTGKEARGIISGRYWGQDKYDVTLSREVNPKSGEVLVLVYVDAKDIEVIGKPRNDILYIGDYHMPKNGLEARLPAQ